MSVQIAVIGDIHLSFEERDVEFFNQSDYPCVLLTGDLSGFRPSGYLKMIHALAKLSKPAFMIPGNHDGTSLLQLAAEVTGKRALVKRTAAGLQKRMNDLSQALPNIQIEGYSAHLLQEVFPDGADLGIVFGRPHSMGGQSVAFDYFLEEEFGVRTMQESTAKLIEVIDQIDCDRLLILAHNGPTGLGSQRDSIWGCDFKKGAGDFGDRDLRDAISYAQTSGKTVLGVVAGHMHHGLRGGGQREWTVTEEGIAYVNAARVPRISRKRGESCSHYVHLSISKSECHAEERYY